MLYANKERPGFFLDVGVSESHVIYFLPQYIVINGLVHANCMQEHGIPSFLGTFLHNHNSRNASRALQKEISFHPPSFSAHIKHGDSYESYAREICEQGFACEYI